MISMTKADLRETLRRNLERELMGPIHGEEEEIEPLPANRYIVGVLYPSNTQFDPEQDDGSNIEVDDDAEAVDNPIHRISMVDRLRPSSMGLSFVIEGGVNKINVNAKWAVYTQEVEKGPFKREGKERDVTIQVASEGPNRYKIDEDYAFYLVWRTYGYEENRKIIGLFLVNEERKSDDKATLNTRCLFTPKIKVEVPDRVILAKEKSMEEVDEEDLKSLKLLYHRRHEFGTGHGCSVLWDDVEGNRCGTIETTFLPYYLQQPISFREDEYHLSMHLFSRKDEKARILESLRSVTEGYEEWLKRTFTVDERGSLDEISQGMFDTHRQWCLESLGRMRDGIELLTIDDMLFEAFCFMNEAMFLQKVQYTAAKEYQRTKVYNDPKTKGLGDDEGPRWRPFQIAFILQSISGVVDSTHKDRNIVDLLWIPTGGGKTEAYLGLAAFTLALRRLRNKGRPFLDYAGVCVIMRYTLRLLTIQQFQRAAALMCACEVLRARNKSKWGQEPFLVGLYVGQSTTPNMIGHKRDYDKNNSNPRKYVRESETAWYAIEYWRRRHEQPSKNNPFQLHHCPWCGNELIRQSYHIDKRDYLVAHCPREGCPFNSRLEIPAVTVDGEIYSRLPSFIIGTVDKFAMLPFNPRVGMLFGHVDRYCPQHGFLASTDNKHPESHPRESIHVQGVRNPLPPPELIIQDELHLINGPLGSMVGMYETTVEYLCRREYENQTVLPKYIASTATIRKAGEQIWNLYKRPFRRFPSPGVDYSDSFFVKEDINNEAAKMFIGIFPSGIGLKTVMVRTFSSLLRDLAEIRQRSITPIDEWDEYWSLVAYFNSIRELGSAKTTMEDDIQNRVEKSVRNLRIEELTSRMDSKDLPEILTKLNKMGDDAGSIDILACSNMFSVGVDVQRLGLMVMNNQPKSTSEYIQSTGRVGRNKTGLVIVLYNWARPRDQSHFERFYDYHNRIQWHVEAMTVTPFSRGVRERALHAQYVSLTRILRGGNLARNSEAMNFDTRIRNDDITKRYEGMLEERMDFITREAKRELRDELEHFLDQWIDWAADGKLAYSRFINEQDILLRRIEDPPEYRGILTPTSMRNVEEEIFIHKVWGLPH